MEKFSHDLTLALEETSRVRAGHCWGVRRRTRSTGNLPCAPQPTEDSSSSPTEGPNELNECQTNSILSDSDDRQNFKLALKARQSCLFGNFESDSLNENFSPTRPNTRRKRKFKRMAVEYETTPSTPGTSNAATMFPIDTNTTATSTTSATAAAAAAAAATAAAVVKKRVMKHTSHENFRANLLFCGKRKRSHRDRYHDYEYYRLHLSSMPRQRDLFTPKISYLEYKNRNRATYSKQCERILPLNKTIISKIEKISQDSQASTHHKPPLGHDPNRPIIGFPFDSMCLSEKKNVSESSSKIRIPSLVFKPQMDDVYKCGGLTSTTIPMPSTVPTAITTKMPSAATTSTSHHHQTKAEHIGQLRLATKSGSFESTFTATTIPQSLNSVDCVKGLPPKIFSASGKDTARRYHTHSHHKQKRHQMKMQLQFDDPNGMDCGNLNDFLSSSSLSSSDSEAAQTNESDREGDDELTDWPGNEAMVNFASKNDFKRAKPLRGLTTKLPQIKSVNDESMVQDDDPTMTELPVFATELTDIATGGFMIDNTVGAADDTVSSTTMYTGATGAINMSSSASSTPRLLTAAGGQSTSMPIDIPSNIFQSTNNYNNNNSSNSGIVESEMSGETSNHFLSSPNIEVREFRAGCRRIRDERRGFTISSSVNEHLSRFLQDSRQPQLVLPYTDTEENGALIDLAKLYSLDIEVEQGRATFTKTINTTQSVKIDQADMTKFLLSDYKRRCYGIDDDSESTEMAT